MESEAVRGYGMYPGQGAFGRTFQLGLVVLRQRLRTSLDANNTPRVSGVGLSYVSSVEALFGGWGNGRSRISGFPRSGTNNVDLVVGDQPHASSAAGNLLFVLRVYKAQSLGSASKQVGKATGRPERPVAPATDKDARDDIGVYTIQDGAIRSEEAVLQRLLVVAGLERILLGHDAVDVLAGE